MTRHGKSLRFFAGLALFVLLFLLLITAGHANCCHLDCAICQAAESLRLFPLLAALHMAVLLLHRLQKAPAQALAAPCAAMTLTQLKVKLSD